MDAPHHSQFSAFRGAASQLIEYYSGGEVLRAAAKTGESGGVADAPAASLPEKGAKPG